MINWGIIGLGTIAKRFAEGLSQSPNGKLYAVASRTPEKLKNFQEKFEAELCYASYEEMLENPEIDAIYIALPHGFHKEWCLRALKAGKAVLCEKPTALSAKDVEEIISTAKVEQQFFMEAMKARFLPSRNQILKEVKSGSLGTIVSACANFCSNPDANPARKNSYYYDKDQGGALFDTAPYPIAFFMDLFGPDPERIDSTIRADENGVDHHVWSVLRYKGGPTCLLEVAFDEEKPREAVITGTKGKMMIPYYYRAQEYRLVLKDGAGSDSSACTISCPCTGSDMLGEIEEVHRCLQEGLLESPEFGWADAVAEARILERCRKA